MTTDIEMDDLSSRRREVTIAPTEPVLDESGTSPWAWASATLLIAISLILSVSPRLLLFLAEATSENLTPLESFLAVHTSIWLSAISVSLVLNVRPPRFLAPSYKTDNVQIPSVPPVGLQNATSAHPLLLPLTVAGNLSAFLAYNTKNVGSLATIVFLGSGIIGIWGAWASLFGDSSSFSKKTGADKHTSAFLFGNKSAASVQKKEWLKKRKS
ncbi:hypothetical protein FB45DRAFT_1057727 [Roridomyces roridus]|uniref:Uncharacterized protein n=1 Tax=Roridomyces roridus TaxID=1738132 RepID=A0AAD7BWW1_9AGAR|nr:hypothetical protein FB45DRAFT_1057727 [Roridomyces roridus]